jgi:hypothetical protein
MTWDAFAVCQLGITAILLLTIGERVFYLCYRARLSSAGSDWVKRQLASDALKALTVWACTAPEILVARLVRAASSSHSVEEALADEHAEIVEAVSQRLRAIRVGATLSSTMGLLVGVLRLRAGFLQPTGLLALEQGLPERIATSQALFSMAIGISTSAICFFALAHLRRAASVLLQQAVVFVRILGSGAPRRWSTEASLQNGS